jgi:hypothetical protein
VLGCGCGSHLPERLPTPTFVGSTTRLQQTYGRIGCGLAQHFCRAVAGPRNLLIKEVICYHRSA